MKILMISGTLSYNTSLVRELHKRDVDIEIFKEWAMYLPDHLNEIIARKPDIINLQWPESVTGPGHEPIATDKILADFEKCLPALKAQGIKLFWTMHNLLPHVRQRLDLWKPLFQMFATYADATCHHSQWGMERARSSYHYPSDLHFVLHHGYFAEENVCTLSQAEARRELSLDLDAHVFFVMGAVRPDKKTKDLIKIFENRKEILLIAGGINTDYGKETAALAENTANVHMLSGWVEAEDASLRARAADAFIFFYGENHLTSGSPHLSQAFELPQITLDSPYNREVLGDSAYYIPSASHHDEKLKHILDTLDREDIERKRHILIQNRAAWDWASIAEKTEAAYKEILA